MNLPEFKILTEKGILILKCCDIIEPNNGRMLYKVNLFLNNTDITEKYFGDWNYINFNLNQYMPNNHEWIYIPKESESFLIKITNLAKVALPYIHLSAATFISNIFLNDYLIVLCSDQIILKNTATGIVRKIEQEEKEIYFKNLNILDSEKIEIKKSNSTSKIINLNSF